MRGPTVCTALAGLPLTTPRPWRGLLRGWSLLSLSLLLLVLPLLQACSSEPPVASLFPLEGGHRWVYQVRSQWENDSREREDRIITTEGVAQLDGAPAWRRRSADGVEWFLRADETGVFRVATKTDLDAEPTKDPQRRYVLKAPLRAGTSWQALTPAYLLKRRQEFPNEIRHTHQPVLMTYVIESLDAQVEVPAGKFSRCTHVRGQAVMRLFADPVSGWRDLPLTQQEWYCHGPGLVKLVREEPALSSFLVGGSLNMELTAWK